MAVNNYLMQYLTVAGSSAAVYIFLIVAIRLFGKKEFSQLSTFDIVFILLISNAVQNSMLAADPSFLGGLCSGATLFVINYIFKFIIYKFPKISEFIQGQALMLIYEGEIISDNLKKAKINIMELEAVAREHGVDSIENIDLAVLEIDGTISILSHKYTKNFKKKRRRYNNNI